VISQIKLIVNLRIVLALSRQYQLKVERQKNDKKFCREHALKSIAKKRKQIIYNNLCSGLYFTIILDK